MTEQKRKTILGRGGRLVAGLAVVAAALVSLAAPVSASAATMPSYCKKPTQRNCLKPITVTIASHCSCPPEQAGGKFDMTFNNPNNVDAPRTITVYLNGQEFFEDIGTAAPGQSTLSYGPLPDGQWRVVVSWDGRVFADRTANFTCGG